MRLMLRCSKGRTSGMDQFTRMVLRNGKQTAGPVLIRRTDDEWQDQIRSGAGCCLGDDPG